MKEREVRVFGIGNPLIDIIVHVTEEDLKRLGLHKGTMHLIDDKRREELLEYLSSYETLYSCGGSCPNTIITLSSLGIYATLAGKVGNDDLGSTYKERLQLLGVHDEISRIDEPTGSSIILITPDSERTMNTYLGANRFYSVKDVIEETISLSSIFHFTGYMWDTHSQKEALLYALACAKKGKRHITFDIADPFAVGRNRDEFLHLITHYADVVFANSEEARILFNNYDPYECCKSMGKLATIAIVKNGKMGSFISYEGKIYQIPVQGPSTPLDTTGAGDIYAAGFLYGLCKGLSIEESGDIASYLAGEIIQQRGAQFSPEKSAELTVYLQQRYQSSTR